MQKEILNAYSVNSHRVADWIVDHPLARRCLILALLCVPFFLIACAKPPLVRTETVEVKVPVRPDIPAEILAPCRPTISLPVDPTVGDLEVWAEELALALSRCNADKAALDRALSIP